MNNAEFLKFAKQRVDQIQKELDELKKERIRLLSIYEKALPNEKPVVSKAMEKSLEKIKKFEKTNSELIKKINLVLIKNKK